MAFYHRTHLGGGFSFITRIRAKDAFGIILVAGALMLLLISLQFFFYVLVVWPMTEIYRKFKEREDFKADYRTYLSLIVYAVIAIGALRDTAVGTFVDTHVFGHDSTYYATKHFNDSVHQVHAFKCYAQVYQGTRVWAEPSISAKVNRSAVVAHLKRGDFVKLTGKYGAEIAPDIDGVWVELLTLDSIKGYFRLPSNDPPRYRYRSEMPSKGYSTQMMEVGFEDKLLPTTAAFEAYQKEVADRKAAKQKAIREQKARAKRVKAYEAAGH
ncbi:hypothetical protein [Persicobacter psychrovividus]|uniref:SH3 domain-containing protein n=1 Tax=Persicobacter psychrovividus TaxID=387638 RepID=A0ABM7VLK1_9BACT|nr:hypothetical protein PEPS_41400 [Persicobacter psychrovividus]